MTRRVVRYGQIMAVKLLQAEPSATVVLDPEVTYGSILQKCVGSSESERSFHFKRSIRKGDIEEILSVFSKPDFGTILHPKSNPLPVLKVDSG